VTIVDELDNGLSISLHGEIAERSVVRIKKTVAGWGLRLPDVEPLVLDFGLGKFDEIGETEFWIANEVDGGYCGKFLFVFDRQTCPKHMHRVKLETFYIVKGSVSMLYDGKEFRMNEGDVLKVEVGKYHRFTGIGNCLLLEVSKPSIIDDNYFEDTRIPIGGNYKRNSE
jgi:mannose-6-phosphate isomerase-like protein (cupin superfamily)